MVVVVVVVLVMTRRVLVLILHSEDEGGQKLAVGREGPHGDGQRGFPGRSR